MRIPPANTTLYTIQTTGLDRKRVQAFLGEIALSYPFHQPFVRVQVKGSFIEEITIKIALESWSQDETDFFCEWQEKGVIGPYTMTPKPEAGA